MNKYTSSNLGGLKKLFQFCLGFIAVVLMTDASGIREWAERLEIGSHYNSRQTLIKITRTWEDIVESTGLNNFRRSVFIYRNSLENKALSNPESVFDNKSKSESKSKTQLSTNTTSNSRSDKLMMRLQLPQPFEGDSTDSYIALVGDSMMAVELAKNLTQIIQDNSTYKVIRAYKSGTGLARPDVYNWINAYPKMLSGKIPTIVICAIGANDAQGMMVDKISLQFGTTAWEEEYASRVGEFADLLLRDGSIVYWVLLPHMRNPVYDRNMQKLNEFLQLKFKDVPNLVFISPDILIVERPVNSYVEYTLVNGKLSDRLRADDGIHLSNSGAKNLAIGIIQLIQ